MGEIESYEGIVVYDVRVENGVNAAKLIVTLNKSIQMEVHRDEDNHRFILSPAEQIFSVNSDEEIAVQDGIVRSVKLAREKVASEADMDIYSLYAFVVELDTPATEHLNYGDNTVVASFDKQPCSS